MKCGISLGAAREKVRVALALFDLPQCSDAFRCGNLSYSKARALTRVADTANEASLLEFATLATASQVEDHCRQLRNVQRNRSTDDVNRVHKSRYLSCNMRDDGSMSINIELTRESGELVMKAIEMAVASLANNKPPHDEQPLPECPENYPNKNDASPTTSFFQNQADALVLVAQSYLKGDEKQTSSTADHYQVMVHVDESALLHRTGKSDLPIESIRRISCDASLVSIVHDDKGNVLNAGRKHRTVSPSLKRALLGRDKCCRYPGCSHRNFLDAHHVMHWVDGGETSLQNTILLCGRHHRLLHEGGYTIHRNFEGSWYFRNGDGKVIPEFLVSKHLPIYPSRDASGDSEFDGQDWISETGALYALH